MAKRILDRYKFYAKEAGILIRDTFYTWSEDRASTLGAALAFYTIFSLAPILIIIVAVVGFFLGRVSVHSYIMNELADFVGYDNAEYVMMTINSGYEAGSGIQATIIAILLMLIGATTICVTLQDALNIMWKAEPTSSGIWGMIKDRIWSLIIVGFSGAFLLLSMLLGTLISAASLFLSDYVHIPFDLIGWLNYGISFILLSLLFGLLFKVLPHVVVTWRDVWIGGVITALLFMLGRILLGLYMARSTISSAYGAAGSLVVILLWVYYCAQIIYLGAEFTKVYAEKYGSPIVPRPRQQKQESA
jgi:membrane protein